MLIITPILYEYSITIKLIKEEGNKFEKLIQQLSIAHLILVLYRAGKTAFQLKHYFQEDVYRFIINIHLMLKFLT